MTTLFKRLTDYLRGSIEEIRKVSWPTKKQTIDYSLVVVIMSLGVAIFFGLLDYGFSKGLDLIIK